MSDKLIIPNNERLVVYQEYITKILKQRGFWNVDVKTELNLLIEEVGELSKAIRKFDNGRIANDSVVGNLEDEFADVFIVLLSIANKCNINISDAFIKKEIKNGKRKWT